MKPLETYGRGKLLELCSAADDDASGELTTADAARREWVLKDRRLHTFPFVSDGLAGIGGTLKKEPKHFRVTERRDGRVGAGALSGAGDHIYVTVEREGMNTLDVQQVKIPHMLSFQHHNTPHHNLTQHATPRRATPRHAILRHTTPYYATPRHATM